MKTRIFTIYGDPGHAWCKVSKKFLQKLGIADKISFCSYMRGEYAYLEEDGDLDLFCQTMDASEISYKFKEKNTNHSSKVRSYDNYCA